MSEAVRSHAAVRMPRVSGLDVLRTLRDRGELPPTILLTTFDDDAALLDGIRCGARGFLLKDVSLTDLTRAIEDVAAGGTLMRPVVTERILRVATQVPQAFEAVDEPERLTPREAETLRLLASGQSNREISAAFGTSEGTVKNHVSSILLKLGVKSRTQAVLKGMELGYLGREAAEGGSNTTVSRSGLHSDESSVASHLIRLAHFPSSVETHVPTRPSYFVSTNDIRA